MPKPPGIDAFMRMVEYSPAIHKVWDAVEAAIDEGGTPEAFRREAAEAWEHILKERGKQAAQALRR